MSDSTILTGKVAEKQLDLTGSRVLAYSESGNSSSSILVLFFHGVFGVGNASNPSRVLVDKNVHFVAPTLPGWGNSSPRLGEASYAAEFAADINALIEHLHPRDISLKLYVGGGSYGTVPAQMLYGLPFDIFPPGRYLKGCLLLSPFSPFRWHEGYGKGLTWPNYIGVGPPTRFMPFRLFQRMAKFVLQGKLQTAEKAESFIRETLFNHMGEEELAAFTHWKAKQGKEEGQVEREFGENAMKSVHKTWEGFMEVADVAHSDWGFRPDRLDDNHASRPVLIVAAAGDKVAPDDMAKWLASTYKNAQLKSVEGGHLAAMFHFDDIWTQFLADEN